MSSFAPSKPVGRFNPRQPMVVIKACHQMKIGFPVARMSYSKTRVFWRRGWVANVSELSEEQLEEIGYVPEREVQAEGKVDDASGQVDEGVEATEAEGETAVEEEPLEEVGGGELEVISFQEGSMGWWTLLLSDGTERKVRTKEMGELGLLEAKKDG